MVSENSNSASTGAGVVDFAFTGDNDGGAISYQNIIDTKTVVSYSHIPLKWEAQGQQHLP